MIRIPISNIQAIESEYFSKIKNYFNYKISNKDKLEEVFKRKRNLEFKMLKYFHENLVSIVLARPHQIREIHENFIKDLSINLNDKQHKIQFFKFKKRMESYYNYFFQTIINEAGTKNNLGRWLSEKMNVKVCPYCNHNYIFTLNVTESKTENKITSKPQFDHYLPKSKYPILSLSLYNLIPSCSVCNKIKHEREFTFYPYDETSKESVKFKIQSEGDYNPSKWVTGEGKIRINLLHSFLDEKDTTEQEDKTTINKQLGLDIIYNEHINYAEEIVDKIFAYNNSYYDAMISSYNGLGKTPEQIESIIWSAYLDNVADRPMSKITNDILSQLKIKRISS